MREILRKRIIRTWRLVGSQSGEGEARFMDSSVCNFLNKKRTQEKEEDVRNGRLIQFWTY